MGAVITGLEQIEQALMRTLAREEATPEQGCSALANVLLSALVTCKRDPRVAPHVADEMRRLAAKLVELAASEPAGLAHILTDARLH